MSEKLITLNEAAEILRVSRHTVQAWVSPSSPNHRPEFSMLARHAGRKTVFLESDLLAWLEQRRGAIYSEKFSEQTAFWRERFAAGRGVLSKFIKPPSYEKPLKKVSFVGGILALDLEPVLEWLADGPRANEVAGYVNKAEGLMISAHLSLWLLRRAKKSAARYRLVQEFVIDDNIFELAAFNQEALSRALEMPQAITEVSLIGYSACAAAGCELFLSANASLMSLPGLRVSGF